MNSEENESFCSSAIIFLILGWFVYLLTAFIFGSLLVSGERIYNAQIFDSIAKEIIEGICNGIILINNLVTFN